MNAAARSPRPWEPAVLEIVARSGQVKLAAECAGVSRMAIYKRIATAAEFADRLRQAKASYTERVVMSASVKFRRAG